MCEVVENLSKFFNQNVNLNIESQYIEYIDCKATEESIASMGVGIIMASQILS